MERLIGVILAVAMLGLTACSAPANEPPAPAPLTDQDQAFLARLDPPVPESEEAGTVGLGRKACELLDAGMSARELLRTFIRAGAANPGALIGNGVAVYCPENGGSVNSELSPN